MVYHSTSRSLPVAALPEGAATPQAGQMLHPDEWPEYGGMLIQADEADLEYFGAILRVETGQEFDPTLPVKVVVTGRRAWLSYNDGYVIRCKIEFLRDCEDSVITGGWLHIRPWK